jgi:hypothetical protein
MIVLDGVALFFIFFFIIVFTGVIVVLSTPRASSLTCKPNRASTNGSTAGVTD